MNFPAELKYTNDHEWIRLEGDVAVVGITEFAQRELGDIVYIDINSVDQEIPQNEIFGTVEAVKTVSDLFMPVSGVVLELNEQLGVNPELVNEDPYGNGWMVKIRVTDPSQVDALLSAEQYQEQIGL